MRIGIISTVGGYTWAGSEEVWKLFAMEALRAGHSVAVSAQAGIAASEELAEFSRLGGVIFPYRSLNRLKQRMASKGWYSRFRNMKRWKPDLVCVSSGGPCDVYSENDLLALLNENTVPQVFLVQCNMEGIMNGDQRRVLRPLYANASRVICVSHENARLLEHQLASDLLNKTILPGPIRLRLAKPLPWPDDVNGEVCFATVARYDVWCKCQDQTLEALAAPEWKDRNWRLSLYGSGSDEAYFKDLVRYYGLEKHVTIKGYERDFTKIWAEHHVHILNSRLEGLTLALIESMFCGRPAVITRAGGNHELMRNGLEGFVSPGMDSQIIRETLERAWANRGMWRAMGEAAFQRADKWVPTDLGARFLAAITEAGKG
jgi:L-malate glycosyltransferase